MLTLPEDTILENRYRIDGLLARGGMGAIYRGFDSSLNTPVAIKENFFQTPQIISQFKQEALILARLHHPALPRVIDHFSFKGRQYLVMDFIEGENLGEVVAKNQQPLPERQALDYIIQVCQAVGYLHRQSPPIIHRDIKPQNIKITPEGRAVLVDFGIAKQGGSESRTQTGARGITPGFSSPEQCSGSRTTPASDIYSLGATLYAVLTAKTPPNSISIVAGVELKSPKELNPKLSGQTAQAIMHAMQVNPAGRPQSVDAWQKKLKAILESAGPIRLDVKSTLPSMAPSEQDKKEKLIGVRPPPATDAAKFWLVDPSGLGYPIGAGSLVIGRHSQADVAIADPGVSRLHARIRTVDRQCQVMDEGTPNGTFLNGHRLGSGWYPLNPGDILVVGPTRFYLTTTEPVKLAPPDSKPKLAAVAEESAMARPAQVQQPAEQLRRSKLPVLPALLILVLLLGLVGVGAYWLFEPTVLSSLTASFSPADKGVTAQAQTAAAVQQVTAQAKANAESTRRAQQPPSTSTPSPAGVAAVQEIVPVSPEPSNTSTHTPAPTATLASTPILPATSTQTPTRAVPVVSGPTAIPLKSDVSVDQLGSREVVDVDFNPKNPREVYVLVKKDGIYRSINGGDGPWARMNLDGSALIALAIDPINPSRLYAPTWNAVLKSTDGGNTWDPKTNGLLSNRTVDVLTIDPTDPNTLYGGVGERLVVSTDAGENWISQGYGEGLGVGRFFDIVIDPFNSDIIYVGGLAGSIYKSVDAGRTFVQLPYNTGQGAFSLAAHPTQKNVYLAGVNSSEAGIIKTLNGVDFFSVSSGLIYGGADSAYSAIVYAPGDPNIVYAGSGYEDERLAKGIFKSIDGGETWTNISYGLRIDQNTGYPYYVKSIAVHPANPNLVFAATGSGLYKSVDGGVNWSLQ